MLVTIILSACLQSDPASCRTEEITLRGSQMACVLDAQPAVVEWSEQHPEWRIASWKCGAART